MSGGHLPPTVRNEVPGWLAARRHGVPASMVAAAAERRAAGDWRGACAAARIDVAVDLDAASKRYGWELADSVRDDLEHLVPDLVRWHLPRRASNGAGMLEPGLVVPLARYPARPNMLGLLVRTPLALHSTQRLRLELEPVQSVGRLTVEGRERWDADRFRWDARCTGDLLRRLGGGDRAPFFRRDGRRLRPDELPTSEPGRDDPVARTEWIMTLQDTGRTVQAWAVAGIDADFTISGSVKPGTRVRLDTEMGAALTGLMPLLRERARHGPFTGVLRHFAGWPGEPQVVMKLIGGEVQARVMASGGGSRVSVPNAWWRRSPDLELLRLGRIGPDAVHPLVRAALFPDEPAQARAGGYQPPGRPDPAAQVPVRCGGRWHRVGWGPGGLEPLSHTDDDIRRERTLAALGGRPSGCFAVIGTWRGEDGRLPRALRDLRRRLNAASLHGDADDVENALAAGVDATGIRSEMAGRTLLHRIGHLDRPDLVARLVAAGIDIETYDQNFATPLRAALSGGARPEIIQALLAAGADPSAIDPGEADNCGPNAGTVRGMLKRARNEWNAAKQKKGQANR